MDKQAASSEANNVWNALNNLSQDLGDHITVEDFQELVRIVKKLARIIEQS